MFQNFAVKNFRCFVGLQVPQLGRVNLIAGKNNSGKTALLEALRLHCDPANGGLPNEMNRDRGIKDPLRSFEETACWLFWGRLPVSGLELSSQDYDGKTRVFTLHLVDAEKLQPAFPQAWKLLRETYRIDLSPIAGPFLISKYHDPSGDDAYSIGFPHNGGYSWTGMKASWSLPTAFIRSGIPDSALDIRFFGEVEASKRQDEILPALRILQPGLERLSLIPLADEAVIHGDVGLPRLVPVPFMGEGMRRVLSFMLAIAHSREGVVLIDEIENGLHYSVHKQVWQAILLAARQNNVQVFATTHSYECITAATEAITAEETADFAFYRLDRDDDVTTAVRYDRDTIGYALEMAHEVR